MCSSADGLLFDDEMCDAARKPHSQRACDEEENCAHDTQAQAKWHYSQWSEVRGKIMYIYFNRKGQ